jgi:hypothetical protein
MDRSHLEQKASSFSLDTSVVEVSSLEACVLNT